MCDRLIFHPAAVAVLIMWFLREVEVIWLNFMVWSCRVTHTHTHTSSSLLHFYAGDKCNMKEMKCYFSLDQFQKKKTSPCLWVCVYAFALLFLLWRVFSRGLEDRTDSSNGARLYCAVHCGMTAALMRLAIWWCKHKGVEVRSVLRQSWNFTEWW